MTKSAAKPQPMMIYVFRYLKAGKLVVAETFDEARKVPEQGYLFVGTYVLVDDTMVTSK